MTIPLFASAVQRLESGAVLVRLSCVRPCLVGGLAAEAQWLEAAPGVAVAYRASEKAGPVPAAVLVAKDVNPLQLYGFDLTGFELLAPAPTTVFDLVTEARHASNPNLEHL